VKTVALVIFGVAIAVGLFLVAGTWLLIAIGEG
jgi:hypothetical protein